ncbi:hypothetical protein V9T40_002398 [Parthenolecanium corni]|uniref:Amine oxidase domain-containing protein n=1 Tax=Parthenolecanium corni TaxID=536013 RepID=A0AAN9TIU0_9HEMI
MFLNVAKCVTICVTFAFFTLGCGAEVKHYNNLIVGGGPAGLYTAWRLSSKSGRPNESTAIFEWSAKRLGGRIFTKTFQYGQHLELGGMRFTEEHKVLQKVLTMLNLTHHIVNFTMTSDRLYYIRGEHIYGSRISYRGVPYKTDVPEYSRMDPTQLFEKIADRVIGGNQPGNAEEWCRFYDNATLPSSFNSTIYKAGDVIGNIGYWNLLMDQLGSEAFQYLADAGGYTANVINQNAAQAVHRNSEFGNGVKFKTLDRGYSLLIDKLANESLKQSVKIFRGQRLTHFHWDAKVKKFYSTFVQYDENGTSTSNQTVVTSDTLFLCMPKNSIDLIHENDVANSSSWPHSELKVLKNSRGKYFIESIIQQPAYKIGLLYNTSWWLNATFPPNLNKLYLERKTENLNYGPSITDLPLRQIYYMGDNRMGYKLQYFSILASYDDTHFPKFWRGLELTPQQVATKPTSEDLQPLSQGTKVPENMLQMVQKQLNLVHFNTTEMKVPKPIDGYFMNWDLNPFQAGYHAWKPHYKLAEAQYYMTRPGEEVGVPLFVAGSAYSNIQGWVEGAFDTAESILVDKFGLPPLTENYLLICRPQNK